MDRIFLNFDFKIKIYNNAYLYSLQKKTLAIVIPCYNEASRLPVRSYKSFLNKARDVSIFFINDGSIDGN